MGKFTLAEANEWSEVQLISFLRLESWQFLSSKLRKEMPLIYLLELQVLYMRFRESGYTKAQRELEQIWWKLRDARLFPAALTKALQVHGEPPPGLLTPENRLDPDNLVMLWLSQVALTAMDDR